MKVSRAPAETLITYSLGSCIGLTLYDPEQKIGGMVHCMLPLSRTDRQKALVNPCTFADTGAAALLQSVLRRGADRKKLVAKIAGGSTLLDKNGTFKIGERNLAVIRKVLWKNQIKIGGKDVGGTIPRTMSLEISTGLTTIKSGAELWEI